jgi:hypothetical protein
MYELLTETKTRPYLEDVQERRLPSTRRVQVQERELQLARMQRDESADRSGHGARRGAPLGRMAARIAAWLTAVAAPPAEDAKG